MPLFVEELSFTAVEFTLPEAISLATVAIIAGLGAILISLILVPITTRMDSPSTALVISQLSADAIFCINIFVTFLPNAIRMQWSLGATGCLINAVCTIAAGYSSMFSLLVITIDRYATGILARPLASSTIYLSIVFIWVVSWGVIGCLPFYTNRYPFVITLQESKFYCSIGWHLTDPVASFYVLFGAFVLIGSFSMISYSYYHLVGEYISKSEFPLRIGS
jgi:hypothetical protein